MKERESIENRAGAADARQEKTYWRSLDRLLDSPAVQEHLTEGEALLTAGETPKRDWDEFPVGASLPPDEVSRRTMLSLMGASFALAGLSGCRRPVETIVPYVKAPEHLVPGISRSYASTFVLGTEAVGVVVESHEGRPTKIEGNTLHPSSGGAATTLMQAATLGLYDPDRSHAVQRRTGEEGDGPATWADFEAAWQEWSAELESSGGEGLAILSSAYASPTQARLADAFRKRFPQARWTVYQPIGDENVFAGLEQATGTACRPVYHLEQAEKIVTLDADFLLTESESLRNARSFSRGRRVTSTSDEMNRLYAVESTLTVTGGAADHRLRLESRQIAAFAAALAAELGVEVPGALAGGDLPEEARGRAAVIAADLRESGGAGVVIAGRRQPPAVHALALAMNQGLGAIGQTVTLHALDGVGHGTGELGELVDAMREGSVNTLVMLGGNPVYDAPADLDFSAALAGVERSVHLSSHVDETSAQAAWHLPESHFLEAWGDAVAADGTRSAIQPLIAPLHDSRSAIEVLGLLASGSHRPGHDLVRETWQADGQADFEKAWHQVLHDGVAGDAPEALTVAAADLSAVAAPEAAEGGMEITFHPSLAAWDGRFANVSWLQELPDAITKATWDNYALVSPATARELGVGLGDRVRLASRGLEVEAPVFILPGQADGSVALALGHGRTAAGRVGNGVGANAYALRHSAAPYFAGGLEVSKAEGEHFVSQTQEHWTMAGRDLIREATLVEYREDPEHVFGHHMKLDPEDSHQPFDDHSYDEGYQWGMTIDLTSCIGCNACVVACQSENNIPVVGKDQVSRGREMHWLRIDRYFSGEDEAEPEIAFQPVPCMHCENAPCEQVCPVAATVHDREGINAMVYNRCIGTRYCSNNCPYKVRRFNFFNYTKDTPELMKIAMNPDVTVRSRGVMEKCSYCLQRVSEAKKTAKMEEREVRDGEVRTACQQTCPTEAIVFGNIRDESSQVAGWKKLDRDYVLYAEYNNRPRTSYLAKLRNPNPAWS